MCPDGGCVPYWGYTKTHCVQMEGVYPIGDTLEHIMCPDGECVLGLPMNTLNFTKGF